MKREALAALSFAMIAVGGCAYDAPYAPPPPPPPGWAGESWPTHVARCLRRYPRYDPRTDLIYRRTGVFRCPL